MEFSNEQNCNKNVGRRNEKKVVRLVSVSNSGGNALLIKMTRRKACEEDVLGPLSGGPPGAAPVMPLRVKLSVLSSFMMVSSCTGLGEVNGRHFVSLICFQVHFWS